MEVWLDRSPFHAIDCDDDRLMRSERLGVRGLAWPLLPYPDFALQHPLPELTLAVACWVASPTNFLRERA